MIWRRETIEGHPFHRADLTRYGVRLALVVGPTTDGRWQACCGGADRSTREIAEFGDYLTTEPTAAAAMRVAAGWAEGV
jgi:hypothetical protein